jgi:hypothetical protein
LVWPRHGLNFPGSLKITFGLASHATIDIRSEDMNRYATGEWLTWNFIAFSAVLGLAGTFGTVGFLLWASQGTLDLWGRPLGTDFSGAWTAGLMAVQGHAAEVYDWGQHAAVQREIHHSPDVPFYGWHYPPFFLLLTSALALLPYLAALALYQIGTFSAYALVVQRMLPGAKALLIAAGFPAVLVCVGHGHNGFLTAALFGGALLALGNRPNLAGILFGCLAYKPQFALVIPLALLAGGYWRVLLSAASTVAALSAAVFALWGWPIWQAFIDSGKLTRTIVLERGATGWPKIQSVFSWTRMLGGSIELAYIGQGLVTAAVILGCAWLWRSKADLALKGAGLATAALMATPYVLDYDLVLLGIAIALLVARGLTYGFMHWEKTLLAVAWLAPGVTRSLATLVPLQLGFLTMAILLSVILAKARRTDLLKRLRLGSPEAVPASVAQPA